MCSREGIDAFDKAKFSEYYTPIRYIAKLDRRRYLLPDKVLTISVAAYNIEAYLRQTLNSLAVERVIDELEVFVVDDGSTDGTLKIAREYAAKYPNSIFAIHKENGGYGTTVNYSIAHATGKYFKLLDGDDWLNPEELVKMVTALRGLDDDVVYASVQAAYADGTFRYVNGIGDSGERSKVGKVVQLEDIKTFPGIHGTFYKTETLRKAGLNLPAHRLYTDTFYNDIPPAFCGSARFFDFCVENRRLEREGQSTTRQSLVTHADEFKHNVEELLHFYESAKGKNLRHLSVVKRRIQVDYVFGIRMILLAQISNEAFHRLRAYERELGSISRDVYSLDEISTKIALFIKLCRRTGYLVYWLLKLIPGGFPYEV